MIASVLEVLGHLIVILTGTTIAVFSVRYYMQRTFFDIGVAAFISIGFVVDILIVLYIIFIVYGKEN